MRDKIVDGNLNVTGEIQQDGIKASVKRYDLDISQSGLEITDLDDTVFAFPDFTPELLVIDEGGGYLYYCWLVDDWSNAESRLVYHGYNNSNNKYFYLNWHVESGELTYEEVPDEGTILYRHDMIFKFVYSGNETSVGYKIFSTYPSAFTSASDLLSHISSVVLIEGEIPIKSTGDKVRISGSYKGSYTNLAFGEKTFVDSGYLKVYRCTMGHYGSLTFTTYVLKYDTSESKYIETLDSNLAFNSITSDSVTKL